jgi:prophage regulatory protein
MPERFLRVSEVLRCVPVSKPTLYRWIAIGTFPAPRLLGAHSVGWKESAVLAWIESREISELDRPKTTEERQLRARLTA